MSIIKTPSKYTVLTRELFCHSRLNWGTIYILLTFGLATAVCFARLHNYLATYVLTVESLCTSIFCTSHTIQEQMSCKFLTLLTVREKGGRAKNTVDNTIIITIERHLAEHVVVVGDSVSLLLQVREDQKR